MIGEVIYIIPIRMEFPVVTLWEVLEHLAEPDLREMMINIDLVLAPNGYAIMSVSHNPEIIDGVTLHQTVRPPEWWEAKFIELGWRNHPDLVAYFDPDFVRGYANAPGSTHYVLSRA